VFKVITTIRNIIDLRTRSIQSRLNTLQISIDDSLQIIPRSLPMIPKAYLYNERMKEAINQRAMYSPNYDRRPEERSTEFSRRLYPDDRRNS